MLSTQWPFSLGPEAVPSTQICLYKSNGFAHRFGLGPFRTTTKRRLSTYPSVLRPYTPVVDSLGRPEQLDGEIRGLCT